MNAATWHTAEGVLAVEIEFTDVSTMGGPYLDPDWHGQCPNGHEVTHRTMKARRSETYWCSSCNDEHDDLLGWECPECAAEVKPGVLYDDGMTRKMTPSSRSYTLNGEPISSEAFYAIVNREQQRLLGREAP